MATLPGGLIIAVTFSKPEDSRVHEFLPNGAGADWAMQGEKVPGPRRRPLASLASEVSLSQRFPVGGRWPLRTRGNVWRHVGMLRLREMLTTSSGQRPGDAAKHPTTDGTAPQRRIRIPNGNGAEGEKPRSEPSEPVG